MDSMYPGITLFARDVDLPSGLAEKYKAGMIIREKGFTDATIRFGGMVTSCRYVILSNHMKNMSILENGTNWGLHVANKDAHFKVLGLHTHAGKTGIFLLHLPDDESWKLWRQQPPGRPGRAAMPNQQCRAAIPVRPAMPGSAGGWVYTPPPEDMQRLYRKMHPLAW